MVFIPKSKGHGIKASFHLAEERTGSFHLQAILLTGVPLVNGGPQTAISGLIGNFRGSNQIKQSIQVFIIQLKHAQSAAMSNEEKTR